MKKQLIPLAAVAIAGLFAVTGALAQGAGGAGGTGGTGSSGAAAGGGGSHPNGPVGNPNQPAGKSTDQGVISRPMGPVTKEEPTDPNKSGQPLVKKMEKETQKQ
jgi:hypothetical protein